MTWTALLLIYLAGTAGMQLQTLPWTPGHSTCFVADATLDGTAEIFVVQRSTLRIYGSHGTDPLFTLELPAGTAALDVADIDHDGTADLVAVRGDDVLRFPLRDGGDAPPEVLFTFENQLSRATGNPFPSVLVVDRDYQPLIALPGDEVLSICDLSGNVVETYPIDVQSPYQPPSTRPFNYGVSQYAQAGPGTALEMRINSTLSFNTVTAGAPDAPDQDAAGGRLGTNRQQWEAGEFEPESWPWFSVGAGPDGSIRALYRSADRRGASTAIRIRTLPAPDTPAPAVQIGPPRNYPGTLLPGDSGAPDLNGDGYTDILLWKSREPSFTADGIARAFSENTWPLRITSHVFVPEKQRYEPRPGSNLNFGIPIEWLVLPSRFGPLKTVLLRDFDGDGRTDFACLTADDTLTVWRADEGELAAEPIFQHQFSGPVDEVLFESDLEGEGRTSLALRAGGAIHILRPRARDRESQPE